MGCSPSCCSWSGRVTQPVQRTHLWPASWLPAVDKSRGSKSVEVRRVWEIYDGRLQFLSRQDAQRLNESLEAGDVFGLVLLSLHMLMLIVLVVVLFLVEVWFLVEGVLLFGL